MVDLLKHIGSSEETAVRKELCDKIQDVLADNDTIVCMDALTSLIAHGALALGHEREEFLQTLGEAYAAIKLVHSSREGNAN